MILSDIAAIWVEQFGEFDRLGAVVERGDELDRQGELFEWDFSWPASEASSMRIYSIDREDKGIGNRKFWFRWSGRCWCDTDCPHGS